MNAAISTGLRERCPASTRDGRISVLLACGSFQLGGSERNVFNIATGLPVEEFSVSVLGFVGDGPLRQELVNRGVRVQVADWSFDPRRLSTDLTRLRGEMVRAAPDVLHLFNYPTIYFGVAAGVATGVPVRIVAIQAYDTWKGWTETIVDRILRPAVTLYLTDGDGTRSYTMRQQRLRPGHIQSLYDGPDLNGLRPTASAAAVRARLGLSPSRFVVGVIGRLNDVHKGQSVFLECIAKIPADSPAQFVLVGGGRDEAALRQQAERLALKDRVVFAGPQTELGNVLHSLDLLVIPSLRYESVPKILLEGMAAARPIIASRVGDIPEFLAGNDTGVLVEPGDPAALAEAIRHLLAHPAEARAMGARARASLVSRRITLQDSLAALADIYRRQLAISRPVNSLLRSRVRLAMAVYRNCRLAEERARWLLGRRSRRSLPFPPGSCAAPPD